MSSSSVTPLRVAGSLTQDVAIVDIPLPEPDSDSSTSSSLSSSDSEGADDQVLNYGLSDELNDSKTPTPNFTPRRMSQPSLVSVHPRMSRALSVPLPSQLSHLQHPHRLDDGSILTGPLSQGNSPELAQFRELSIELADSVQAMIQTMLQVSPPHILDPAKEHVSACSLSVPTPSMSALFTAMKNLNYISANMSTFCIADPEDRSPGSHNDFDIGETLQSVGDVLSGAASKAGVELVLYHADVGLKHIWVKGDENGISYLLSHVVRQVLSTARRGDCIEIGLHVVAIPAERSENPVLDGEYRRTASPVDLLDGPLRCSVLVSHKYPSKSVELDSDAQPRSAPLFSSLLLRRLINKAGATFNTNFPAELPTSEWTCEVTFTLERGTAPILTPGGSSLGVDDALSVEPTIEQLTAFVESLRGKKVTLYASSQGSFAHHLTSYLTAWGLDVSHGDAEGIEEQSDSSSANENGLPTLKQETRQPNAQLQSPSFIFIDDDVAVLKQRLDALRVEQPPQFNIRKRPSLAPHRTLSSPQIARARGQSTSAPSVVVVHFASLSNFKIIKDVVQSVLASYVGSLAVIPEVMIIPKPAGPRRLLTALHTALTKPVVDAFFSPIATSPSSPGIFHSGSFMSGPSASSSPRSPLATRPTGSRSSSDRSSRSGRELFEHVNHPPPSPLGKADNVEYFSEAALGTSPSSGYVIQSPDGKPTGIFFHPNPKAGTPRIPSNHSALPSSRTSRRPSAESNPITFASLHEASTTFRTSPTTPSRVPPAAQIGDSEASGSPEARSGRKSSVVSPTTSPIVEPKPVPPLLKSIGRRSTSNSSNSKTQAPSPNKKGKSAAESNIVPPVSVLIVDDNPINQTILSTFMKKKKIKYDVASDGAEAVEKWRTGEFHLILMDIQMPVMDGIDATKEIRRLEKANASDGYISGTQTTPFGTPSESSEAKHSPYRSSVIIVALTASSLQTDRVAALAAGCNDFLTKPVSLHWLNSKIIEWGSIKALQMWADPGAEITNRQTAQARSVAERLHVPEIRKSSPSRPPNLAELEPPSTALQSLNPNSALNTSSSAQWSTGQPSPPTFRAHMGIATPAPVADDNSRATAAESVRSDDSTPTQASQHSAQKPSESNLSVETESSKGPSESQNQEADGPPSSGPTSTQH